MWGDRMDNVTTSKISEINVCKLWGTSILNVDARINDEMAINLKHYIYYPIYMQDRTRQSKGIHNTNIYAFKKL